MSAAALVAAALAPATAGASFVTGAGAYDLPPSAQASFLADDGEANNLTIGRSGQDLIFTDSGSVIQSDECTVTDGGHTAICAGAADAPFGSIVVFLGDGNDTAVCTITQPFDGEFLTLDVSAEGGDDTVEGCDMATGTGFDDLAGGTGSDTLRGRGGEDFLADFGPDEDPGAADVREGGNDRFFGGAGPDTLSTGSGNDEAHGQAGDDFLSNTGADGNDLYDGGTGLDSISYDFPTFVGGVFNDIAADQLGAIIRLDSSAATTGNGLPGENDSIAGFEDAFGSRGADQMTGSALGNVLFGSAGNDTIVGAAGNDNIDGGGDADNLNSQDGEVDRVACGGQVADRAQVDNIDQVSDDCPPAGQGTTVVNVPPPSGPVVIRDPRDERRAVITRARTPRRVKTRTLRRTGRYRFRLQVDEVVTGEFSLSGRLRGGRIATAGYLTLAERRRTLAANRFTRVTLRIPRSARRTLRRGKNIRLLIQLRDAGNNLTSRRVTIRLT